jgi:hypothetical protein
VGTTSPVSPARAENRDAGAPGAVAGSRARRAPAALSALGEALPALRGLVAGVAFAYTWYLLAGIRTTTVGNADLLRLSAAGALLSLWCCALPFLGHRWRGLAVGALGLFAAALVAALVWANVEESLLAWGLEAGHSVHLVEPVGQTHPTGEPAVRVYTRWWPFSHHAVVYAPGSGWFGTD